MAITFIGSASTGASSTSTASITHGLTILSGDLITAVVARNLATTGIDVQGASGGATWTDHKQADGPQSMRYSIQYVIANSSEPSTYTWALNTTQRVAVHLKQFRGVDNSTPVDVSAVNNSGTSASCATADITVASGAVALAFGMADIDNGSFSGVDSSFLDLTTVVFQRSGLAYRIYASGGATGAVTLTQSTSRDYETEIMSFAEAGGAGSTLSAGSLSLMGMGI